MAKKTEIRFAAEPRTGGLKPKSNRNVTFGKVTVASAKPKADVVARNVAAGQSALKRAADKISRPGISLRPSKGVPLYYVDDARPKEIVRELDGQKVYGVFHSGKFVASNG
ncbi:hypothetical protein [Mesorhizobium sp. M0968]|uniref:hypothetical protein n=1 Tax=Mesorhizobium sp. M0968 TaxID=2957037 RepID=UPI00333CA5A8